MADSDSLAIQYFGLDCPDGGDFYICEKMDNEFIGCCTSNPCADNSGLCPKGHLRSASFDVDKFDDLQNQSCDDSRQSSVWYICENNRPPFMGCCDISPCADGCPRSSLLPAILSPLKANRQSFLNPEAYASSKATSSAASSATSTASATSSPGDSGGLSTGAVAGIAAGSAAFGAFLLGLLIWKCWCIPRQRRRAREQFQPVAPNMQQSRSPGAFYPDQSSGGYYQHEAFSSVPNIVPQYPSGYSVDHDGKLIPHYTASDQPVAMNTPPNVGSVHGQGYGQSYTPVPMVPVQEVAYNPPQELSTGQEPGGYQSPTQTPIMNQVTPQNQEVISPQPSEGSDPRYARQYSTNSAI
ncbi:hypothetical protein G7Z17_g4450 [Cylindrodendrum hubeiense]|uniref:Uncharacterized protein n=1 Tax=Cylindrodendrum hubeiense TaxID=595255 RepID=A0A9P5HAQ1_9HYPO|nr:hypothetical protein G7Z17_g4450 [Cylindrodendrum hubeiense]